MPESFYHVINLLGGLTLFLYGASLSTEAFRSSFGAQTREAMSRFTRKKPYAMVFGMLLAAVVQGSAVSTSIAISFVDVGLLSLTGSVVVMMGASIGGTLVTFLVSLDLVAFSPLSLAVSYVMVRAGRGWVRKVGNVLHSVSLILIGMLLLKLGTQPLLSDPAARSALVSVTRRPLATFCLAAAGTAVLQSSASVMALAVTLAMSGALPQSAVFPVALGAHLGSAVTMLLTAMGGRRNARALGAATFLYKLVGVVAFLPLVPWAEVLLIQVGLPTSSNVALAQTLVVLLNAAAFYAWPEPLARGSAFLLSFTRGAELGVPLYLDEKLLNFPSLATRLLAKEMVRLANHIEALLQTLLFPKWGGEELKGLLPTGITELAEACERYMYLIRPPAVAEDPDAGREYQTISYAMLSLKESAGLVTGHFRKAVEGREGLADGAAWNATARALLDIVRDAFHAFALGDASLAQKAVGAAAAFDAAIYSLRGKLLFGEEGRRGREREESAFLEFITLSGQIARSALEVARGDNSSG
ncbi:MAG: Na/Pi symporter [Synergistaceae bacterium]|jgi:Na/Pi-cotransporter|nr:Na/Pi symporter [Synergistaceae bacterium]